MLVVIQFPLIDLRTFIPGDHYRLEAPPFPLAEPNQHFIRSTGQVKMRPRGALRVWPEDSRYCDARSAIRLFGISGYGGTDGWRRRCRCAFRRFYSDGRCSSRFEIGLVSQSNSVFETSAINLIRDTLDIPASIPDIASGRVETRLVHAVRPLAKHLLDATTMVKPPGGSRQGWWVSAGRPLLLFEYDFQAEPALPPGRNIAHFESQGIRLHHAHINYCGKSVATWFLGIGQDRDRATLRELRLHLMRLHAEMQCMMVVLRAAQAGRLANEPMTAGFEALQRFLNDSLRLLRLRCRHGLPQASLLEASLDAVDAIPHSEMALLTSELSSARRQVRKKVEAFAALTRNRQNIMVFTAGGPVMTGDRNYNIDVGGNFTGVIGEHNTVQDSFNRIEEAEVSDELKDALRELTAAAAQLYQQAPLELQETAQSIPRDLETFREEALAKQPRLSILEAVGKALAKTAELADELGKPVIKLITTVLKLFA